MTAALWWALARFLWVPYADALNNSGWFHVHDVEATYVPIFGPVIVGIVYVLAFVLIATLEHSRSKPSRLVDVILAAGLPAIVVTLQFLRSTTPARWNYPGAELAVALTGLALLGIWELLSQRERGKSTR
jgi:hypothetical protein